MDNQVLSVISFKNKIRVCEILEIIIDELDLQVLNRLKGNEIPWEYFEPRFARNTVLSLLELLKKEFQQTFEVWNINTELIKAYLEPIHNQVYQEGIVKEWTEDQIKSEFNKRAYNLVLRRFEKNLVLIISKDQLMKSKELLAFLKAKLPIKKDGNEPQLIHTIQSELEDAIPKKGQYKVLRRIARLYADRNRVENWKIAGAIHPTLPPNSRKFSRRDYSVVKHNPEIKNRFITLKKLWKSYVRRIKHSQDYTEIIRI